MYGNRVHIDYLIYNDIFLQYRAKYLPKGDIKYLNINVFDVFKANRIDINRELIEKL